MAIHKHVLGACTRSQPQNPEILPYDLWNGALDSKGVVEGLAAFLEVVVAAIRTLLAGSFLGMVLEASLAGETVLLVPEDGGVTVLAGTAVGMGEIAVHAVKFAPLATLVVHLLAAEPITLGAEIVARILSEYLQEDGGTRGGIIL